MNAATATRQFRIFFFYISELCLWMDTSETMVGLVDEEIHRLLTDLEARGRELLEAHRTDLDVLVSALEKQKILEAKAIRDLLGDASARS